jgi:hypothetical protein
MVQEGKRYYEMEVAVVTQKVLETEPNAEEMGEGGVVEVRVV